jgi:F0F1-type ATP synthase membrane subunit b/b'
MSTGLIIAIVVAALILLALFVVMGRKGRERKLETRRHEAREIGREAEVHRAEADRTRAEADAQSAEARRQEALARERAAEADERHQQARDRHIEAAAHHPDMDESEAAAEFDRRHAEQGTGTVGDSHEATPAPEDERRFGRDSASDDDAARGEEYQQEPRR